MLKRVMQTLTMVIGLAALVFAAAPPMINYQGRLTDAAGSTVADGSYSVVFTIYDAALAGTSVWTETQNVNTTDGLFTVLLGSVSPVLDSVFNGTTRYLGIAVAGDPELSPRTALVSVPYAHRVSTVDGAAGGNIMGDFAINLSDSLTENYKAWQFDPGNVQIYDYYRNGTRRIQLNTQSAGPGIFLIDSNLSWKVGIFQLYDQLGGPYGAMRLLGDSALLQIGTTGFPASLSNSTLNFSRKDSRIDLGGGAIVLDAGATGDNSVLLPKNALGSSEILDEPGIAANQSIFTDILQSRSFQKIDSVVITTPGSGYVIVQVVGSQISRGSTGRSFALYQISETLAGRDEAGHTRTVGREAFSSNDNMSCQSVVDRRLFFKPPGMHTFYFEGRAATNNATSSTIRISDISLVAMYFPTSYGSVGGLVANPDDYKNVEVVNITNELTQETSTVYKVDLSELEKRAREAEFQARKAMREAHEAFLKLERAKRDAELSNVRPIDQK